MKRTLILFLAFLILIILLLTGRHIPFGAGNSDFHVEDIDRVTGVAITDATNNVGLEKKGGKWYVNGDMETRTQAMDFLLKTLKDIRIKSPVSSELFSGIYSDNNTSHIEVNVYHGNKTIRSFHIYRNNMNGMPGIMMRNKRSKPYFMHIPGYDTDPCLHFVTDERFWMPFIVFRIRPDEIDRVEFVNRSKPDSSFSIVQQGGRKTFFSPDYQNKRADSLTINRYLSYFSYVPFETWAFDLDSARKDSIVRSEPRHELMLIDRKGDSTQLLTWPRLDEGSGGHMIDTDRLWASINGGKDLFIIKYYDMDPLIKNPGYFISD